jgi:hypothetical protein
MTPDEASARIRRRDAEYQKRLKNFLVAVAVSIAGHIVANISRVFDQQEYADLVRWCERAVRARAGDRLILEGVEIAPAVARAECRRLLAAPPPRF